MLAQLFMANSTGATKMSAHRRKKKSVRWQRVICSTFPWPCVTTSWLCWLSGKLRSDKTSAGSGEDVAWHQICNVLFLHFGVGTNETKNCTSIICALWRCSASTFRAKISRLWLCWFSCLWTTFTWSKLTCLVLTHNRESCSIALASLSTVLVLCDAAVGGQSVFLLHFWDIQGAKRGQEETVTWQKYRGGIKKQRW